MFLAVLLAGAVVAVAAPAPAQSIGVAPCDDYVAKIEGCLPKMPPSDASMERGILDAMRKSWVNIAKNASVKPYLEESCKKFMDNIKTKLATCSLP
jgi:hypothetical protein